MERRRFLRGLGAVGLVGLAGCTSSDTEDSSGGGGESNGGDGQDQQESTPTATEDATPTEEPTSTDTATPETSYAVRILYNGAWQGSVGTTESTRSIDGEGDRTIAIEGEPSVITVNAQKQDGSDDEITVQVLENSEVIEESSSTSAYGLAQASASLFGGSGSNDSGESEESPFSVRIQYNDAWQGSISTGGSSRSISGDGTKTIDIEGSPNIISVNAQKQDDSDEELTVQILENDEVVKEASTTASYGLAQVSYSNF